MPLTTAGELTGNRLYLYVYGETGCGKTMLALSLSKVPDARDIGWITAESNGPTSLATAGYPKAKVWVVHPEKDPFAQVLQALANFAADTAVSTIVLDGLSVLSGRAIDFMSKGEGEKALGFEGWGQILNNFRTIERQCEKLYRNGRNIIFTSWEAEPVYETDGSLKTSGGPYLQGQSRKWLPGNVDVLCRMTSRVKTVAGKGGSLERKFEGELMLHRKNDWTVRTKWGFLPSPFPADLSLMLKEVEEYAKKSEASKAPAKSQA